MTEAKTWQKTVLSGTQLDAIGYPILPLGDRTGPRRVAEAQAEITGNIAFKVGMNKVAEWVGKQIAYTNTQDGLVHLDTILISLEKWQVFKKENGL